MMNGGFVSDATDLGGSRTLAAIVDAPYLTVDDRIETLYLAAYARRPIRRELDFSKAAVNAAADEAEGLADLFWVLLNSSEFLFNH